MQIHELNDYSGSMDSEAYFAVDNGVDTGKVSAQTLLLEVNETIEQLDSDLNGRIDNIIAGGDAPSAAEVTDARRGANGVNYASLGDAIRGQVDALTDDVRRLGVFTSGAINDGTVLFTSDSVSEGDVIYYDFDALNTYSGYIDILNKSGTRITFIGKGSADYSTNIHFDGSYTIPSNFGSAKVAARRGSSDLQYITLNYLIGNKLIKKLNDDATSLGSSVNALQSSNTDILSALKNIGVLLKKEVPNATVLFTNEIVNIGDKLHYSFDAIAGASGYIDILDTAGTRITYIGKGSSNVPVNHYEGEYIIPNNFGSAVVKATRGADQYSINFNYLITNNLLGDFVVDLNNENAVWELYDYKCNCKNRLANPLYTTIEDQNAITREIPLNHVTEGVNGYYRIPTCIYTNNGTLLVAAERRDNGNAADKGVISIDLVRKPSGGSWGTVDTVLPYDSQTYGRFMDPCFVIDRTGGHGVQGRIYLFAGTFLNDNETWSYNDYADSDMIYIYSDDDGVTWSSPTSVKSAWDASEISVLPAPCNGIQLTNGTLVIPVFGNDGVRHNNSLMYKTTSGVWTMAPINDLVSYNINENTIVEHEANKVLIMCNNGTAFPRITYPDQYDRYCTPTFEYDFSSGEYKQIPSTFDRNTVCQFSVQKVNSIRLMSFPDTNKNNRPNITIWASTDCNKWIRCFRAYSTASNGYSVVTEYNSEIGVAFEDTNGNISFEDISSLATLFSDSCDKYIDNISVQDRMQILINSL